MKQHERDDLGVTMATAHGTGGFEIWERPVHDGALHCVLCSAANPGADHDWCAAVNSLLCDGCCAALLDGDLMRMFSIAAHAGRVITPDALVEHCSECSRGRRQAEDRMLEDVGQDDAPAC